MFRRFRWGNTNGIGFSDQRARDFLRIGGVRGGRDLVNQSTWSRPSSVVAWQWCRFIGKRRGEGRRTETRKAKGKSNGGDGKVYSKVQGENSLLNWEATRGKARHESDFPSIAKSYVKTIPALFAQKNTPNRRKRASSIVKGGNCLRRKDSWIGLLFDRPTDRQSAKSGVLSQSMNLKHVGGGPRPLPPI